VDRGKELEARGEEGGKGFSTGLERKCVWVLSQRIRDVCFTLVYSLSRVPPRVWAKATVRGLCLFSTLTTETRRIRGIWLLDRSLPIWMLPQTIGAIPIPSYSCAWSSNNRLFHPLCRQSHKGCTALPAGPIQPSGDGDREGPGEVRQKRWNLKFQRMPIFNRGTDLTDWEQETRAWRFEPKQKCLGATDGLGKGNGKTKANLKGGQTLARPDIRLPALMELGPMKVGAGKRERGRPFPER